MPLPSFQEAPISQIPDYCIWVLLGEPPLRSDSPQLEWPAMHLSGIPRDAVETTFNAGRPGGVCCFAGQTTSCFHAFASPLPW
jgi:hypothetical protein